jgi:hypothetical protein
MVPEATANVSGAGSRSYHSSTLSSAVPSPAAIWCTTDPHAVVSTPGVSSSGTDSMACPNPMMSNSTMGWS